MYGLEIVAKPRAVGGQGQTVTLPKHQTDSRKRNSSVSNQSDGLPGWSFRSAVSAGLRTKSLHPDNQHLAVQVRNYQLGFERLASGHQRTTPGNNNREPNPLGSHQQSRPNHSANGAQLSIDSSFRALKRISPQLKMPYRNGRLRFPRMAAVIGLITLPSKPQRIGGL